MMSIAHRISGAAQRGRLPPARLVADRHRLRAGGLRHGRALLRRHPRARAAVPVHLVAGPPHARRHPPPDLGHRPRRSTRRASRSSPGATIIGSTALTILIWVVGYALRGSLSMATPLKRVRGLGAAHRGTETFWRQRLTASPTSRSSSSSSSSIVSHIGASYGDGEGLSRHARRRRAHARARASRPPSICASG